MNLDAVFKALAHPTRRGLLAMMRDGEVLAGDLAAAFDVAGPTISVHLRHLREAGLVSVRAEGARRWYEVRPLGVWATAGFAGRHLLPPSDHATGVSIRSAYEITLTETVPLAADAAWRAWSDPGHMGWMGELLSADPVESGVFSFVDDAGSVVSGAFVALHPPSLLVMAWNAHNGDNIAEVHFSPVDGGTSLFVRQLVYRTDHVDPLEQRWQYMRDRWLSAFA